MPMKVTADASRCVGAGVCKLTAPEVFDQDENGVVAILSPAPHGDDLAKAREAGVLCPSGAVRIIE
jgi:ferredoxin